MNACRRRLLRGGLALTSLGLLAGCGRLAPPPPPRTPRIGALLTSFVPPGVFRAFREALRELGYEEGRNLLIEYRFAERRFEQLPNLATELVAVPVDLIVAQGAAAVSAARQATHTIPIVMAGTGDPVGLGLVAGLARPGGNITGVSSLSPQLSAKRLELLTEVVPGASRIAILWNAADPDKVHEFGQTRAAAMARGVQLQSLEVRQRADLDGAFGTATERQAEALIVLDDDLTFIYRTPIVDFAARQRLPAIYGQRAFANDYGLMSYGASPVAGWRRAAAYVDKILKGTSPAELPIEQPTTFDFVVNLFTARALGLTIPDSVLQQATEVIQ